jgi:hypothetical protein
MTQRDRQDEAIAIIRRLFKGERVTAKSDWFTMNDAALQLCRCRKRCRSWWRRRSRPRA